MEPIVNIAKSFEEAEEYDFQQNISMTPEERLDISQRLSEEYNVFKNENRKGLQGVYRIIKWK